MATEKTKDLLKMLGGAVVVSVSAVWFLTTQIHAETNKIRSELRDETNSIRSEMSSMESRLSEKISSIDKRLAVVETVLILQGYPIKNIAMTQDKEGT